MNEALRSGRVDPAMAAEIDALRTALTKLPDHHGMVYRGTPTLPPAVLARYRPGSIIDEKAFVSSSTKNGVFTGAVRYRIMSSRAN
ncbi:hypothetical protein AB0L82_39165 [Nocardia sp. NPDC052001]|uniref:hypothetical protein n=1 Tax=Nocardia sp. NPDC052001 TaxID=3154853 RepID=UPI003414612E